MCKLLFLFFLISLTSQIFSNENNHTAFYSSKVNFYLNDKLNTAMDIGVEHFFGDSKYRMANIGLTSIQHSPSLGFHNQLEYGKWKTLNASHKLIFSLIIDNKISSYNSNTTLFIGGSILKRISNRWVIKPSISVPLLSLNTNSSTLISFSLNYFHGRGISYKQTSDKMINKRHKLLWFFWIND